MAPGYCYRLSPTGLGHIRGETRSVSGPSWCAPGCDVRIAERDISAGSVSRAIGPAWFQLRSTSPDRQSGCPSRVSGRGSAGRLAAPAPRQPHHRRAAVIAPCRAPCSDRCSPHHADQGPAHRDGILDRHHRGDDPAGIPVGHLAERDPARWRHARLAASSPPVQPSSCTDRPRSSSSQSRSACCRWRSAASATRFTLPAYTPLFILITEPVNRVGVLSPALGGLRMLDTLVGAAIGMLVTFVLWPSREAHFLRRRLAEDLTRQRALSVGGARRLAGNSDHARGG